MAGARRIRDGMGAMAKSLERDLHLESLLAVRKQQLGIGMEMGWWDYEDYSEEWP